MQASIISIEEVISLRGIGVMEGVGAGRWKGENIVNIV